MNWERFDPAKLTPERLAWLLCGLTFPLIWIGGLITTTDAGMAVPDWPGTYGWNLFLYPWTTWLTGPWDLFIEHGHRLFASLVGLVTIGFVVVVRKKGPSHMMGLAWLALALVLLQGVLGGLRVLLNERQVAMAHGVTGPLFFALTCVIVGRFVDPIRGASPRLWQLACATVAATYAQLSLGAVLRHMPEMASPWTFATIVKFHLVGAGVVALLSLVLAAWAMLTREGKTPGILIGLVVLIQLSAGIGTWMLKYGLPGWAEGLVPATIGANVAGGLWQTTIVTAHQAGGSLLLGTAAFIATKALSAASEDEAPAVNEFHLSRPV